MVWRSVAPDRERMPNYRRAWVPGGTYFFTVNLQDRRRRLLVDHIAALRAAFVSCRRAWPFTVVAMVVLPDHLHCVWSLPSGDADNAVRWGRIKAEFTRSLPASLLGDAPRSRKGGRGVWQRRYWEHLVRDAADLASHIDYVHFNPVKHGHAARAMDWPHSTFHQYVARGVLPAEWGVGARDRWPDGPAAAG